MKLLSKINATFFLLTISCTPLIANVGGMSGSNIFTIEGGNSTEPTYRILSASTFGPAVFQGTVSAVSGNVITFATYTDDNNDTVYPFFAAGSFDPDVMIPQVSAIYNSGSESVTGVSFSNTHYSDMFTSSQGFTSAPEVIISPSDTGGDDAEATANLEDGKITSFTVASGGSGYTTEPDVTIVAGPHFARIIDQSSTYYGRCFLISANTRTTLTLDMSNADNPSDDDATVYFSQDTLVEVVPAATLGSIFGSYDLNVSNWSSADSWWTVTGAEVDWVYIFESTLGGYTIYTHIDEDSDGLNGWYSRGEGYGEKCNNTVIYPDEAFIIARRSADTVTIQSEIAFSDAPGQILLPESGERYIANNPFGMDLLLGEIIPSNEISDDNDTKFRAAGSSAEANKDTITILAGATWKEYWYDSDINSGVTTAMKAGARSVSGGVSANDLFIGSGIITDLQSCSDAAGDNEVTNYNNGDYTKISASNITRDLTGFTITLSGIEGYMLSDDGANEVNATTGETVDTNGTGAPGTGGSIVYSNISGNFEVVGGASGFVVIKKQRDVNFKSNEGSPVWNIGNEGAGYDPSSSTATWYAIGGGGSGAKGTITTNVSGQYSSFYLTSAGSGYSSAPQIVISGGGWRYDPASDASQDDIVIGASDGIIISRGATDGEKSFIEISSPTAE